MNETQVRNLKIIIFIVYLMLIIGTEFIYRNDLFFKSLNIIKDWQSNMSNGQYKIFKILVSVGSAPGFITLLAIIHLFFPIHKSYTFLCVFIIAYYFNNWMKILYSNPRPFWIDPNLKKSCNGGFGNPSGHAMDSTAVFLAFSHIITDFKYFTETFIRKIVRVLIFLFFIGVIIAIMLSRVYLGAHSVNQIIYGSLLGLGIYVFVFFILEMHKLDGKKFFGFLLNIKWSITSIFVYIFCIIVGIITWKFMKNNENRFEVTLQTVCPNTEKYRKFYDDGLYGILSLYGLVGAHLGLILLAHLVNRNYRDKHDYINDWFRARALHNIYRILINVLFSFPFVLIFVIPGDTSLGIIFIFKVSVPYLLTFFSVYGPCVYFCIHFKICNRHIYDRKNFHSDIELPSSYKDLSSNNSNNIIGKA